MRRIVIECPDVKLRVIGKGTPENISMFKYQIENKGLTRNIKLCEDCDNATKYLKNARVYISTENVENAMVRLLESKSFGIPAVCYHLPFVDAHEGGKGVITVPIKDNDKFARAVVSLIKDDDLHREMSQAAMNSFKQYRDYDHVGFWKNEFERPVLKTNAGASITIDRNDLREAFNEFIIYADISVMASVAKLRFLRRKYERFSKYGSTPVVRIAMKFAAIVNRMHDTQR